MQVHHGWSGEIANGRWAKFTIVLEEDDLRRLVGEDNRHRVDTSFAYRILELEAERLVWAKLVTRYGYDPTEGRDTIAKLRQQVQSLVDSLGSSPA